MTRSVSISADALPPLLSNEPTVELVNKAKGGDRAAVEALLQRCLPSLTRWARGRLPVIARGHLDTSDLVQEAAFHAINRLEWFEPRHVGSMQAYLRQSVLNRIRDEVRRVVRRPPAEQLSEEIVADHLSPLELAIREERYDHYRLALAQLNARDRALVVAHLEAQWNTREIQKRFAMPTDAAARMAVLRALRRLWKQMHPADRAD